MTVGEKIKSLRNKRGYSQEVLADKIQTSRQTIYHWENNITLPNINDIKKLSDALDCDHDYFFNEETHDEIEINTANEVISDLYKGVKKHWRKIYIYFFISGSLFVGMGLLIRFINNQMNQAQGNFPVSTVDPSNIFKAFSNFTLILGFVLLITGFIFFIKDYKKQKSYQ